MTALSKNFNTKWEKEISKMLSNCELEQLLNLDDFYDLSSTTLAPLKYLSTVTLDLICEIYKPALLFAFVNED